MLLAELTAWVELAVSLIATPLVLLFLYTLLTSSLNRGAKVFLTMNGVGLLFLATTHTAVAVYRLVKPGEWLGQDAIKVVANVPLFLHQLAYTSCTTALLLITMERMIIGLKPSLYVDKCVSQRLMIMICVLFEVLVALPCAMLLQDGPIINGTKLYTATEQSQKLSLLVMATFDAIALLMVIISFRQSSKGYNHVFFKSTLGTRHLIKEVITLTRVLIPICCSSLLFKFAVLILAYFAFGNLQMLDLLFTIIRFCCTAAAIVEPLLLLTRHRLLQKRLRLLLGLSISEGTRTDVRDSTAVGDVYFDAFRNEMNRNRTR